MLNKLLTWLFLGMGASAIVIMVVIQKEASVNTLLGWFSIAVLSLGLAKRFYKRI